MLFNTFSFWLFFAVVLALFYTVPFRYGRYVLLLASYWFYMAWDWRFGGLLAFVTAANYLAGALLPGASERMRKVLLWSSLGSTLGVLGFFKYYDFFCGQPGNAAGYFTGCLATTDYTAGGNQLFYFPGPLIHD